MFLYLLFFFFFKQKTAYEMRISDWSSDVCSSDLKAEHRIGNKAVARQPRHQDSPSRTILSETCTAICPPRRPMRPRNIGTTPQRSSILELGVAFSSSWLPSIHSSTLPRGISKDRKRKRLNSSH